MLARIAAEAERRHPDDDTAQAAERHRRIDVCLDGGMGSCLLRKPANAAVVREALEHFHGTHYQLLAWVVMPNHVHVLLKQRAGGVLARLVQSWKTVSAKRIGSFERITGRIWQRDYWDRYIRNEDHYLRCVAYIHDNPVKAGLVGAAEEWTWSSARGATGMENAEGRS